MLEVFETTIPQLTGEEKRKVYVYVPDFEGAFPVLYMFDGQNLFDDEEASYGKSWGLLKSSAWNAITMQRRKKAAAASRNIRRLILPIPTGARSRDAAESR